MLSFFAMRMLDRYIISELLKVFSLAIFVLIATLVLERVNFLTGMLLSQKSSVMTIGKMLFYLSPTFLTISSPLAILMASLMVFSRLSAENEITVMRASGISLYRLLGPVAIVSMAACLSTLYLSTSLEYKGNIMFRQTVAETMKKGLNMELKERRFNSGFTDMVIHVDNNRNGFLVGVFISDMRSKQNPKIIEARTGRMISDKEGAVTAIDLYDGIIHTIGKSGMYQTIAYTSYTIRIDYGEDENKDDPKGIIQMSLDELNGRIAALRSKGEPVHKELVEFHKRFAMPMGCLVLGLLGVPLGMMTQRRGTGGGFGLGVMMIVVNYLLWMIGQEMGQGGDVDPAIAMWSPNLIMSCVAMYLIWRVSKDAMPGAMGAWLKGKGKPLKA